MNPAKPALPCSHCKSARVHRSHRTGGLDQLLFRLGADLKRCHDCRRRYAHFKIFTVPLGVRGNQDGLSGMLLASSGFTICLLLVLWIVRRLAMQG